MLEWFDRILSEGYINAWFDMLLDSISRFPVFSLFMSLWLMSSALYFIRKIFFGD